MIEIESEIVLDSLPKWPEIVKRLAQFTGLELQDKGMTSTFDRLVDTEDLALLAKNHSLRVRQKLDNVYQGSEIRLTYKFPVRDHERLFIRREKKLTLPQTGYDNAMDLLSNLVAGITDDPLKAIMIIEELAHEAYLGPKDARLCISLDQCTYSLPRRQSTQKKEIVLEIESHGLPDEVVLKAADWVLKEYGGREAIQPKYARGMRILGRL